jgi:hypothetical protein
MRCPTRECNVAFPSVETFAGPCRVERRTCRGAVRGDHGDSAQTASGTRCPDRLRPLRALRRWGGTRLQLRRRGRRLMDALGPGQRPDQHGVHAPRHRAARQVHLRRRPARHLASACAVDRVRGGRVCGDLRGDGPPASPGCGTQRDGRAGRLPDRLRRRRHRTVRSPASGRLRAAPLADRSRCPRRHRGATASRLGA